MSVTWTEEAGVAVSYYDHIDDDGSEYRLSPFYFMLANKLMELRLRIDRDPAAEHFPVLMDFKAKGVTDYLALIVSFGGAEITPETHEGLGTSWSTHSPAGFSEGDIAAMRQVLAPLALALRVVIKDQITRNTLNTFHGPLVGGRILSGLIKRGAGERLAAALWYSDLHNSTGLADALPVEAFLDLFNVYFDCAAGAVTEEGGHVLDIIGDAILAFFPASASSETEACASALRAASNAQGRLAALKERGNARGQAISFGVGIHFGDMVFGNAGTPERLKFGVIGRAVNEVARTADMAKFLKREVVVSDAVANRVASRGGNGSSESVRLRSWRARAARHSRRAPALGPRARRVG
jgi:adenylate cyclase